MAQKTEPRGPIAAMYNSPGPAYALPPLTGFTQHDPRSVHGKRPAWGFGVRHAELTSDASPGPVHYPSVKYTRYGIDGSPHYSVYGRAKDVEPFKPPGPGAYSPEKSGPTASHQSPRYSFGSRTRLRGVDKNPGPNAYSLPSLLGKTVEAGKRQAPAYTQRGRSKIGGFDEDLQTTPGPGNYITTDPSTYRLKAPQYSLQARRELPGDNTKKPGPGAHSPEKVVITTHSAPAPSFGVKHSEYTTPLIVDVTD